MAVVGFTHCQQLLIDFDQQNSFFKSSSDPRSLVTFRLCCEPRVTSCVIRQDSPPLLERTNLPLVETFVLVSRGEKAREILGKELQDWPVGPHGRRQLIDNAMSKAWEMIQHMPPHHDSVHLHFRVKAFHLRVVYVENGAIDGGLVEDRVRMVPADETSIECLEKKKMMDCGTDCSVCLEEICGGEEGLLMPCCHVFHEDCIKKWLRTSHCCPVCRYQMPKRVGFNFE